MSQHQLLVDKLNRIIPTLKANNLKDLIHDLNKNYGFKLPINHSNRYKQQNINTLLNNVDEIVRKYNIKKDDQLFASLTQQHNNNKVESDNKAQRLSKLYRQIHTPKIYINTIKNQYDELKEYWRANKVFKSYNSFNYWRKQKNNQQQIVNDIMERLERTPHNWRINFEQLTNSGRKLLFPLLKAFFEEHIDTLPIINKYKISYKVNGDWHSKQLKPETYNELMKNFTEEHFLFDLEVVNPEFFYEAGGEKLPDWSLFSELVFSPFTEAKHNKDVGGSFFQYLVIDNTPKIIIDYLKRLQIFDTLVNDKNQQRDELNDCCFIYALKQTDCYDENTLNQMRLRIQNRYLSQTAIESLCNEFKIHLKLSLIDDNSNRKNKKTTVQSSKKSSRKSFLGVKDAEKNRTHVMNVYENHYFIEEKTPFSTYYIKHIKDESPENYNKEIYHNKLIDGRCYVTSSTLVRELMKQGYFRPITYSQNKVLKTVFYKDINANLSDIDLEYDDNFCTKLIAPKEINNEKIIENSYWYCDFEADVSGDIHKPFMCVIQSQNGKINKEFRGDKCNIQLLEYLPNNAVVYFHNLAYDIRMLASFGIYKSIIKGSKTMKADIKYKGKTILFKDTLPILSCKLSQLPRMFNIPNIQKEIFPYKYYTLDRLNDAVGVISEAGNNEDRVWNDADYELFNANIDKIDGCRLSDNTFDMWKYCSFYCQQDVNILRLGFNEFRNGFIKDFNIDPFKYISISSLANEVFNQRVYYPNKNLYKLGGHVRYFCSKAIYGGRCMTAYNKKWHTTKPLSDFDAVSLYPSAMARLYTVEGKPKVITEDKLNYEFLSKQSAYIVEIEITNVNKHYPFPLIVRKTDTGLNLNDDNLAENETIKMIVDNITLEDLIEFQKIEYNLIRGYYWDGKRDYTIQAEIRNIFNKRKEYKMQKNPLEALYKLIMNSCYGKTIEKPVDKDYKYFHEGDELDKYWLKNYNKIVDDVKLANSDIHAIRTLKPIDKHFNFSLLGIQVLSMSKRIMNEVMCLAYDIGCHIYYQDTDSMHIECDDVSRLADAFKSKYGRELIGTDLGQFHSDFPTINNHTEMPKSIESYFIMKKMYIDKLQDSTGDIDYMFRAKGITQNAVTYAAKSFNNDYMKLYESLYNGQEIEFDLTQGQPCFSMNTNMTVSTLKKFERRIKTTYEEGSREQYFSYSGK